MSSPICSGKTAGRLGAMDLRRKRRHILRIVRAGCQTPLMQDAFGYVIFGVTILAAIVAVVTLGSSREAFKQIGANGLNDGSDRPADEPTSGAGFVALRDEEARQMLEARNARRTRKGQAPLDVEAELARLVAGPAPGADPQLVGEVRDLVRSRNRRRIRQGKEPLDVETEVRRQLADLS
jgi:hypothetical protein